MIVYKEGNIFYTSCFVMTNPTNSVGVMGAGLAKKFHSNFKEACEIFNDYCISHQMGQRSLKLVKPMLIEACDTLDSTSCMILMFPTKIHWKNPSKYEYIEENLKYTRTILDKVKSPSIAFPALGCGLGGLNHVKVFDMIEKEFENYPSRVEIYTN